MSKLLDHKQWLYHPELGGELFNAGDEWPEGWYDTPDKFPGGGPLPKDASELKALGLDGVLALAEREGIEVDPEAHFFTIVAQVKRALKI